MPNFSIRLVICPMKKTYSVYSEIPITRGQDDARDPLLPEIKYIYIVDSSEALSIYGNIKTTVLQLTKAK